jgi:cytochrome P450
MDAASQISFSEPLGSLRAESDVGGSIQLIRDRFFHWGWWSSIPDMERLIYRNPISMRLKGATPAGITNMAVTKLRDRMTMKDEDSHADLLQRFIRASEDNTKTLDMTGVVGMLMSTISGAGDTTATSLTAIFYNLLKHQHVLDKLIDELSSVELSDPPAFTQVSKLPYLNAVIKEAMRVYPATTLVMERKVPEGGIEISGLHFAQGTSVGCMPAAVHSNPAAFDQDFATFRPERWLEADETALRAMEMAHLGFSRGRRVCLGQHIAVMQMKKVVALLLMKFKVSRPSTRLYPFSCSKKLILCWLR